MISLREVVSYSGERIKREVVLLENYITTDNILANKGGITVAANLPPQGNFLPAYQQGNILIANIRPYLKKIWFANREGGASADVLILKVEKNFDPKYIYYALFRDDFFDHLMRGAKGTKMPRGDKEQLLDFLVPKFDIATQRQIGAVFSALDAKIDLNNRINGELEAMAKTLYDYWFVQFDFPNAEGKPYKTSGGKMVWNEELKREIPVGWKVENLEYCIEKIIDYRGKTPAKLNSNWSDYPDDIIALSAKHVKKGSLVNLDDANRVDEKLYDNWMKDKLQEGDILMTSEAPCGEFFYLIGNTKYCLSQRLFAIRSNSEITHSCYLYYELSSGNGYSQILGKVSGSTVFGIRQDELRTVNVLIPDLKVQNVFSSSVTNIYRKIRINDYQNEKLIRLRDWLLPMLMNGQITVGNGSQFEAESPAVAQAETLFIADSKKAFARQVLGGKIVSLYQNDPHFSSIKFQKIQYLAEHVAEADLNGNYYYQAAGPYDNVFMHTITDKLKAAQWFDKQGSRYVPLSKQTQIDGYYQGFFKPVVPRLNQLFSLMANLTDIEAEIIATLYAVWNNRIMLNQLITDELLIEDFYNWSERKLLYTQEQLQQGLQWMRTHNITPNGFGKELKKAKEKVKRS